MNGKTVRRIFLVIVFLAVLTISLIPFVNAVILYPYPTTIIHLTTFNTYIMWTQTITCDSLTVNETHATFSNIHMGSGDTFSSLRVSVQSGNMTLTQLAESRITYLTLSGSNINSTVQLLYPEKPSSVRLDNVEMSEGDSWLWNTATYTLTLWVDLSGSHTSSQFQLTTLTPITPPIDGFYPPITNQTQNITSVTFFVTNSTIPIKNYIVFIENLANSSNTYSKLTDQYGYATFNISRGSYTYQILYQNLKIYEGKFNVTDTNLFIPVDLSSLNPQPIVENWVIANAAILFLTLIFVAVISILYFTRRKK